MSDYPFRESARLINMHFERKKTSFQSLSLRWLAQKMEFSPPFISAIFAGKKALPFARIGALTKLLDIDPYASRQLQFQILKELGLDQEILANLDIMYRKEVFPNAQLSSQDFTVSKEDDFFLLGEWFYLPLLELVSLHDFDSDPKWISQKLGLSVEVAQTAWTNLLNARLIEMHEGKWRKVSKKLRLPSAKADVRFRKFHSIMLSKVEAEMRGPKSNTGYTSRMVQTAVASSNEESFLKAKAYLEEAMARVVQIMNEGTPTRVYSLSLGLVPVTTNNSGPVQDSDE